MSWKENGFLPPNVRKHFPYYITKPFSFPPKIYFSLTVLPSFANFLVGSVLAGVEACMKSMGLVDEKYYEIEVDVHGIRNGPNLGRLRLMNKVFLFS